MDGDLLIPAGIGVIVLGVLLVIIGAASGDDIRVEGGGVVFIGPIPIVFGTDRKMVGVSIVLGLVVLGLALLYWR